jgi:hypothetical protein
MLLTRVDGQAFSGPVNNHNVAAKRHAAYRPRSITFLSDRISLIMTR